MNTMSAVITSDLVSLRDRGKYQGYANIAYGVSAETTLFWGKRVPFFTYLNL